MRVDLDEINEAKKILKNLDPEMVIMAVTEGEVDRKEVDRIKGFLNEHNPQTVRLALAELSQEVLTKEVQATRSKLAKFSKGSIRAAVTELGFLEKFGLCFEDIGPCGTCIVVMLVHCGQDMYARIVNHDAVVNPALQRAVTQARQLGEY